MNNPTFEKLNSTDNPNEFCGVLVAEASVDGAERWQFGDKFATRWHQESDVIASVWNGFGIDWDDQIPLV